jgi:WD40 repeat protein
MKKLLPLALVLLAPQLLARVPAQTARTPELYVQTGNNGLLDKIVLSPKGTFVASLDWTDRNFIKVWSVGDGKELATFRHEAFVDEFQFSPDENFLFSVSRYVSGEIKKWSVETGRLVDRLECGRDGVRR